MFINSQMPKDKLGLMRGESTEEYRLDLLKKQMGTVNLALKRLEQGINLERKDKLLFGKVTKSIQNENRLLRTQLDRLRAQNEQQRESLFQHHLQKVKARHDSTRKSKQLIREILNKRKNKERLRADSLKLRLPTLMEERQRPTNKSLQLPNLGESLKSVKSVKKDDQQSRLQAVKAEVREFQTLLEATNYDSLQGLLRGVEEHDQERQRLEGRAAQVEEEIKFLHNSLEQQLSLLQQETQAVFAHQRGLPTRVNQTQIRLKGARLERMRIERDHREKESQYDKLIEAARLVLSCLKPVYQGIISQESIDDLSQKQLIEVFARLESERGRGEFSRQREQELSSRDRLKEESEPGVQAKGAAQKYEEYEREILGRKEPEQRQPLKFLTREELHSQVQERLRFKRKR